jgi:hypothetical protein
MAWRTASKAIKELNANPLLAQMQNSLAAQLNR